MSQLDRAPEAPASPAAPAAKRPDWFVVSSGLITTAITLFIIYLLDVHTELNPMGWYLWFIVPVGAIAVGWCAGSGYGLASWLTGVKIRRGLIGQVILLQIIAYFLAQYIAFRQQGFTYGFWEHYDRYTREITFKLNNHGQSTTTSPLGVWGYGVRALEVLGFALGGIIAPAILQSKPYCESCQVYMKSRTLGLLPAGVVPRKVKKSDLDGMKRYEAEQTACAEEGAKLLEETRLLALKDDPAEFLGVFARFASQKKDVGKRTTRIEGRMHHCPRCHFGLYRPRTITGQGKEIKTADLPDTDLPPDFVEGVLKLPKG